VRCDDDAPVDINSRMSLGVERETSIFSGSKLCFETAGQRLRRLHTLHGI
jgi:hypothetical protein